MTPEQKSRQQINRQLEQASWIVQDNRQMNITAGLGVAGLKNFQEFYRSLVDHWYCFDGSMLPPELFVQSAGDSVEIIDSDRWGTFFQSLGGTMVE